MRFHRWLAGVFISIAALATMPLGCGAAQEEYTEVLHAPEPRIEPQPEHWSASDAITEELRGCVKQHARELDKYSHQAKFDVSITEEGTVKEVTLRSSTLRHAGLEACLSGALKNVSVPSSMLDLRSSGPISGGEAGGETSREARNSVGVVQVVGGAVALGPIVIIAAGVTLGVYILAVATEETIEAVKRRNKREAWCYARLYECLGNAPGDCNVCFRECKRHGYWDETKCPLRHRPN
jgi:hypothetical protein